MEKLQGLNKLVMETDESLEIQKAFEKHQSARLAV